MGIGIPPIFIDKEDDSRVSRREAKIGRDIPIALDPVDYNGGIIAEGKSPGVEKAAAGRLQSFLLIFKNLRCHIGLSGILC